MKQVYQKKNDDYSLSIFLDSLNYIYENKLKSIQIYFKIKLSHHTEF